MILRPPTGLECRKWMSGRFRQVIISEIIAVEGRITNTINGVIINEINITIITVRKIDVYLSIWYKQVKKII